MFKNIFVGLVAIISMSACVNFPGTNQDPAKNNRATFNKDLRECKEDYPEVASGLNLRQWESCMNLKGWK